MKFTDGYWLMRPGVTGLYASTVDDVRVDSEAGSLTVFAPTALIRHRGDTLNRAMITMTSRLPRRGSSRCGCSVTPVRVTAVRTSP